MHRIGGELGLKTCTQLWDWRCAQNSMRLCVLNEHRIGDYGIEHAHKLGDLEKEDMHRIVGDYGIENVHRIGD